MPYLARDVDDSELVELDLGISSLTEDILFKILSGKLTDKFYEMTLGEIRNTVREVLLSTNIPSETIRK